MSTALLSANQIDDFRRDGALALRGAFVDWMELLEAGAQANLAAPGEFATESLAPGEGGRFLDDYCNWQRIDAYREFALTSPCARLAAEAMGSQQARFFHEHLILKESGTCKATPWHHDLPYYPLDGDQLVSVWIALDPIPLEQTVRFVAGSHRWDRLFYPRAFLDGRSYAYAGPGYEQVPEIDESSAEVRILEWKVEPGDAVLFHFRTLHGARAATLDQRRLAIAFRWLGDDVLWRNRPGRTSPPFPELRLEDGAPLPADAFPVMHPPPRG